MSNLLLVAVDIIANVDTGEIKVSKDVLQHAESMEIEISSLDAMAIYKVLYKWWAGGDESVGSFYNIVIAPLEECLNDPRHKQQRYSEGMRRKGFKLVKLWVPANMISHYKDQAAKDRETFLVF